MKTHLLFIVVALFSHHAIASTINTTNCRKEVPGEPAVYSEDFKWSMTLEEIRSKAAELYQSPKRLRERAYYDEKLKSFIFPFSSVQGGEIKIPENFITAVTKHVEKAFERKYIDAVMFPDMGHSHFLIPTTYYNKVLRDMPVNQMNIMYQMMMAYSGMKVVYHTAEQLKSLDDDQNLINDKAIQWRYYTRNLIGHNNTNPDIELFNATDTSNANTMHEIPGYFWWGAGFNIHASKDGCFPFIKNGKKMFFDLSLKDLEPQEP